MKGLVNMGNFSSPTEYYYCPDYKKYVKREGGMFFCIEKGVERFNDFYSQIDLGEIYTEDISKEKYYDQLY
ncbi:hypothetical protein [Aerococcus urinae]|uniref:hypothetical protein n=1 Tax=Aerococcus urinae TaxID=1376 RepID=UPI001E500EBD|nr:hypothetical protein [Aerococcus urinae]MCY3032563.1 hypothetical protein [Aerococcus urinae]MCY3037864.1 hypothetical protein [Aerococcus urinae]MCY3044609.1 hypothetical protein [Aerococcus urinae]MCY3045746.1 hypothetical protein [Aerococcus urinae]MCY3048064.1 hypothetical protein [Aerococcus urinae]